MRDPARIPALLAAIHNVWKRNPDLRLAQVVIIAATQSGRPVQCPELFSLEDDDLLRGLHDWDRKPPPPQREWVEQPNDRFLAGERIEGVALTLNQHVRFVTGALTGKEGFVISLEALVPEPTFSVERMDNGSFVTVPQSSLEAVE